jgi:hypothetical protein
MIQRPDDPQIKASDPTDHRARSLVLVGLNCCDLVGRTGFEPVTSSVSVQGSYLAGSHDLAMGGSGGEPRSDVVRCRCCHRCCQSICSVGVGKSSRTVRCGLCAGTTFHSCPPGIGVVQRLGYSLGYSRGGTALIPNP